MKGAMKDPGLVATFNKAAETYDQRFGTTCGLAHRLALAAVTARGLRPESVLDIGCGTGALLDLVSRTWPQARLLGVDPAHRMIEVATRRLSDADLRVAVAEHLPLPDGCVDLVLSTTSFNHWSDHRMALREAARVLAPGGLIVVVEHAPPGLVLGSLLRLTGRMVPHHSQADFAELALDTGVRPLSITSEEGGFLRLLAQHDPEVSRRERS
jgi:ubiquinone/menaquinone biosynthesis C-methylase UbiE